MSQTFSIEELRAFSNDVFVAAGLSLADAEVVTEVMIHADLRGHASHGLTRIPIYAERLVKGAVNARPNIRMERPAPAFLYVDADNAPGPVASLKAIEAAIATAKEQGVCVCVVAHSNHNGAGSYYALKAAEAGCVMMGMTNAPPSMAVFGGRQAVIGTNPFTFAAPTTDEPIVADMATSVVARGKIVESAKRGDPIPLGWALDADGKPTEDAKAAEAGVVLPFGGPKGSAIAIMVEILCGVMSGGRFASSMGNLYSDFETPQDIGHFFLVIDAQNTHLGDTLPGRVDNLRQELKASAPAEGFDRIRMPGEIENEKEAAVRRSGITLPANVVRDLDEIAVTVGVHGLSVGKREGQKEGQAK